MTCGLILLAPFNPLLAVDPLPASDGGVTRWLAAIAMALFLGILFQRWVPNWSGGRRSFSESILAYVVGFQLGDFVAILYGGLQQYPELLGSREGQALIGAVVGAGIIWAIGFIGSWVFRKPAMGFGDVKWMGMLGATIGPIPVLISFFLACLLGSVIGLYLRMRRGQQYIPFGPFLSVGAISWILFRPWLEALWNAYLGLFQS